MKKCWKLILIYKIFKQFLINKWAVCVFIHIHCVPKLTFLPIIRCFRTLFIDVFFSAFSSSRAKNTKSPNNLVFLHIFNFSIFSEISDEIGLYAISHAQIYVPGGILLLLHRPINLIFQIRTNFRKSMGESFSHEMTPPP